MKKMVGKKLVGKMKKGKRKKVVGLVLSGGASRVFAQLGVLKILSEFNFKPDVIAGCSIGSFLGVCLAADKSLDDVKDWFFKQNPLKLLSININKSGLLKSDFATRELLKYVEVKNFEDLKIPLKINVTNINSGNEEIFDKNDLFPVLNATISVPGLFSPKKIGGEYYVDGGVYNPVPIEALSFADLIIVIDISFFLKKIDNKSKTSRVLTQATYIAQKNAFENVLKKFDDKKVLIIKPDVENYAFFEFKKDKFIEMYELGMKKAREILGSKKGKQFLKLLAEN